MLMLKQVASKSVPASQYKPFCGPILVSVDGNFPAHRIWPKVMAYDTQVHSVIGYVAA